MQVKASTLVGPNYASHRAAVPAPVEAASGAADMSSKPADTRGGLYGLRVRELSGLLNMARPKNPALGQTLIAPQMALSLQSQPSTGDTFTDVTNQRREYVTTDSSLASRAREMVQLIGDGKSVSLAQAIKALTGENPGKTTNSESVIEEYFDRLDRDDSGTLTEAELLELIEYHYEHQDNDPRNGPRLPAEWA
jgi:hypothetical protein